ncbi:MAG: hypothetical protein H6817_10215 [Phycisphaerales bacterium]|nr:hypothetical protein [Phycisphaerales bacterium]
MFTKRSAIVALTVLNLLLLAGFVLSSYSLPTAHAQGRGRPGDYVMATCQIHEDYDAIAVINIQQGGMYVWVPRETKGGVTLAPTGSRNLALDFGR